MNPQHSMLAVQEFIVLQFMQKNLLEMLHDVYLDTEISDNYIHCPNRIRLNNTKRLKQLLRYEHDTYLIKQFQKSDF